MPTNLNTTRKPKPTARRIASWLFLPIRIAIGVLIVVFDLVVTRFLVAGILTGIIWIPLHFAVDLGYGYWIWPTLPVGALLMGLWDGCDIFGIRSYFSRLLQLTEDEG